MNLTRALQEDCEKERGKVERKERTTDTGLCFDSSGPNVIHENIRRFVAYGKENDIANIFVGQ